MAKTSLLLILALCLVGCASIGDCTSFAPIRPSSQDVLTDGLARQILTHNETGARNCGWRP